MIKVKNVDRKSTLRKQNLVVAISSCDSQYAVLPFAGKLESITFSTTAAVIPGLHYVVSVVAGTTGASLADVSQTLTTVANTSKRFSISSDVLCTAGSLINLNASSTANYAPHGVVLGFTTEEKDTK